MSSGGVVDGLYEEVGIEFENFASDDTFDFEGEIGDDEGEMIIV